MNIDRNTRDTVVALDEAAYVCGGDNQDPSIPYEG